MDPKRFRDLQVASGEAMLARRADAARLLEEARAAGDKKSERQSEATLRRLDKLIAEYRLGRYA